MSRLDMDPRGRPPHVPPPAPPSSKRRGRLGTAAKAMSAALAVAVLAWGVRYGNDYLNPPPPPPGPVPVIGPDAGPVKVIPDNPGGVTVPDQDKVILNGDKAQPKVEQLLPPPETPLASPGVQPAPPPAPQPVAQQPPAPPPQSSSPAEAPSQAASLPEAAPQLASPPPPAASISPRPAPVAVIVPPPPPKPAMTAATPAAPPPAAAVPAGKGYFLQLGSVRSAEDAQASWTRLKTAQPDILAPLPANAVKVDLGPDRGVYYRIMAGPIADEASAARSCNTLKQRNVACILVKP